MIRIALRIVCVTAITASATFAQDAPDPPQDRTITQLRGELYVVRDQSHYTVFLVTEEGILLADPLNLPAATWLKAQLDARFPGRAVRYVLHSHHHFDRAEGAGVYASTAQRIAHRAFNSELARSRRSLPTSLAGLDVNRNGMLDAAELASTPETSALLARDRDGNGAVTADELYRYVTEVRSVYESRRTVTLGGKTVQMVHPGPAHSSDMTVLYFQDEGVVFAVDSPLVTAAPFSFASFRPRDVLDWLDAIAPLNFDTLVFGNGEALTRDQLVDLAAYLDALKSDIALRYERGQSLDDVLATPLAAAYRSTAHYAAYATQAADIYRGLRLLTVELSGSAITNYELRDSTYCSTYIVCTAGGAIPAVTAAATLFFGPRSAVVAEMTFSGQSWTARAKPLYQEEVALRQSRRSLLLRYGLTRGSGRSIAVLGGVSRTEVDARGMNRVQAAVVPIGGRHLIGARSSRLAYTFGVDVKVGVGGALSLVAPIRVSRTVRPLPDYWPSALDVQAGIGVGVRLFQRVD